MSTSKSNSSNNVVKTSVSFVPPTFSKLGRNLKDLLSKKYDFTHTLKTIHKSSGGVSFETGVKGSVPPLFGYLKSKFADPLSSYEIEGEASTDNRTTLTVKFPRLSPGLVLTGSLVSTSNGSVVYSTETEYATDSLALYALAKTDGSVTHPIIKGSATVGLDGVSIGGQFDADLSGGGAALSDYNLGLEYSTSLYSASLISENQADTVNVGVFYKYSPLTSIGASGRIEVSGKKSSALTFGTEYLLDQTTTIKSKLEVPTGTITAAVEHKIKNPQLQLIVSGVFSPLAFSTGVKADKFGVGITLGDY